MFGLFKSRKSALRQRLERSLSVRRTWYEWTIDNGRREAILVVEFEYDTDPGSPHFDADGLEQIAATLKTTEPGEIVPERVRIIPRVYES